MDWSHFDNHALLAAYCSLMAELQLRRIVRSANNPVADYTESLVSQALGLSLESQSQSGFDARDTYGVRYQIKGRRLTPHNKSPQLSALRNLSSRPFDTLAAVVYSSDLSVLYGALIPIEVVMELSRFSKHSNSHIFTFRRSVMEDSRVKNITSEL